MVIEYAERYYMPAADRGKLYQGEGWTLAKQMVAWRSKLRNRWHNVRIELGSLPESAVTVGDSVQVMAKVWLNGNAASDVIVELVTGESAGDSDIRNPISLPMTQVGQEGDGLLYAAAFTPERSGSLAVAVRVSPYRQHQILPIEPLIRWA
jgi:hypothetical protein